MQAIEPGTTSSHPGPVLDEFEKRGLTLKIKRIKCFPFALLRRRNLKMQQSLVNLESFGRNAIGDMTWLSWRNRFRKGPSSNCFLSTWKQAFSNSSGLKSVFENLRFRGGLVWTVGQMLWFQISLAQCALCLILPGKYIYFLPRPGKNQACIQNWRPRVQYGRRNLRTQLYSYG